MQYLSWASVQIPVAFVTGLSFRKTSKTVEHTGGYITARGFETAEISAQIEVSRATCMAMGIDFNAWYGVLDGLSVATDGESGAVTLGGYPLYPELKFALTNKNTTRVTDLSSSAPLSIASVSLQNHVHQVVSVSAADAAAIVGAAASGSAATTAMTTGTPK